MSINRWLLSTPSTGFKPNVIFTWGDNAEGQLGNGTTDNRSSPTTLGTSSWVQVSTGEFHTLAIAPDRSLYVWGNNQFGQLGDSTTVSKSSPIKVGSESWSYVCAGRLTSAGITTTGELFAWGNNTRGQVGRNVGTNFSSPVKIGTSSYKIVSVGDVHTLAITSNGKLFGWGAGGLVNGVEDVTRSSPIQIGTSDWLNVSAGYSHSLAIDVTGKLYTWGNVGSPANYWKSFSSNEDYFVGVRSDGLLFTSGVNNWGQLGDGTQENRSSAVQIGTSKWSYVNTMGNTTYAITEDGKLFAWGAGHNGQIGDGNTIWDNNKFSWSQVFATVSNGYAIRSDNKLFSWGGDGSGQLGTGRKTHYLGVVGRNYPGTVGVSQNVADFSWTQIADGDGYVLGLLANGALYSWGLNAQGQLGDGTTVNKSSPTRIGSQRWSFIGADSGTTAFYSGLRSSFAIALNGDLYAWGNNQFGQLGDSTTINRSSPVLVPTTGNLSFQYVTSSTNATAAIASNGAMYVWGVVSNGIGGDDLFLSAATNRSSPVSIGGTASWSQVSLGLNHAAAIRTDGTLWTWGNNSLGQLGTLNFTTTPGIVANTRVNTSFITPATAYSWTSISSSINSHTVAIRSDGSLWGWGFATSGQLGDGTTITKSSPVQIGTSSWSAISAGSNYTVGIVANGALYTWGTGTAGVLGNGTTISRSSPIQIGSLSWSKISAGGDRVLALNSTGVLFGWGNNVFGLTGDGTTVNKSSPVQIGTSSWSAIAAGTSVSAAIRSDGGLFTWGATQNNLLNNPVAYVTAWNTGSWVSIASSLYTRFGVRSDGSLWAWGYNSSGGSFGDGTTIRRSSPVQIGTESWTYVGAGADVGAFALHANGALFGWGANAAILGLGTTVSGSYSSPVKVGSDSWLKIATEGAAHTAAINSTGTLFTWGVAQVRSSGVLGDGYTDGINGTNGVGQSSPVRIGRFASTLSGDADNIRDASYAKVASGRSHTLALLSNGALVAWGRNQDGQLGDSKLFPSQTQYGNASIGSGPTSYVFTSSHNNTVAWVTTVSGSADAIAFNGGAPSVNYSPVSRASAEGGWSSNIGHTTFLGWTDGTAQPVEVALKANGMMATAGPAIYNQRTTGGAVSFWATNLAGRIGTSSWTFVAGSAYAGHSIDSSGKLYGWGSYRHLANLDQIQATASPTPTELTSSPVFISAGSSWSYLSGGDLHILAIGTDGSLWAWGDTEGGKLGNGMTISTYDKGPISWVEVSAWGRGSSAIARTNNGELYAWGSDSQGELGLGSTGVRSSPVKIGTESWSQISHWTGSSSISDTSDNFGRPKLTLAIHSNGALYAWGNNIYGSLGDGTTISQSSPVKIGSESWLAISAADTVLAIHSNGALYAWGRNAAGTMGDGTTISKSSPVKIGSSSWSFVRGDQETSAGIRLGGNLFTWGNGFGGSLGDGTTINKSSPVQIGSLSWSYVGTNSLRGVTTGISSFGLYMWGINSGGDLGDGTTINKSSPVKIGALSWISISSGENGYHGIVSNGALYAWGDTQRWPGDGNTFGVAGIGRSSPVKIGALSWTSIASHYRKCVGLANVNGRNNIMTWGDMRYWGRGATLFYEIGSGSAAFRANTSYPVNILAMGNSIESANVSTLGGLSGVTRGLNITLMSPTKIGTDSWTVVSAGFNHSLGIASNGALYAWGNNAVGQIGDGTTLNKSVPTKIGDLSWSKIAAGNTVSFGMLPNGQLLSWGNNAIGMLGDATLVNKSSPVLLTTRAPSPQQGSWGHVYAGPAANCAFGVTTNGKLYVWGGFGSGVLGNSAVSIPREHGWVTGNIVMPRIISTDTWSDVFAVNDTSYAIHSNGALYAWGNNNVGQLGDNTTIPKSSPVQIGALSWTILSRGSTRNQTSQSTDTMVMGIVSNGALYAWGNNVFGQLGDNTTVNKSSPVKIGSLSWSLIGGMASSNGSMATLANGQLYAWGNTYPLTGEATWLGTLELTPGSGSAVTYSSPVQVGMLGYANWSPSQVGSLSWSLVSVGQSHIIGTVSNGALYAWGNNIVGQLGDGTTINKSSPVQIGTSSWSAVNAGLSHSLAVDANSRLFAWGLNAAGTIGDGTTVNKSSPVLVGNNFNSLFTGGANSSFAINANSRLFAWGLNDLGQLSTGHSGDFTVNRSSPVQIPTEFARTAFSPIQIPGSWTKVVTGPNHTLAISSNGQLYVWGDNGNNALGLNATTQMTFSPSFSAASGRLGGTYAIKQDGSLFAWGSDAGFRGKIGDGDTLTRSSPVQIGTQSWVFVNGTGIHTAAAIHSNGSLFMWGVNASGQLGINDNQNRSSPVKVGSDSWTLVVSSIDPVLTSAATGHTVGIAANGALYAWGHNALGQLGDGTTVNKNAPVKIGNQSWTAAAAGRSFTMAIHSNGALYIWGGNNNGPLGDGTTVNKSSPIQIGSLSWSQIAAGTNTAYGIISNGAIYAWGLAAGGTLGDGTTVNKSSPVKIGAQSWSLIASSSGSTSHVAAVNSTGTLFTWGVNIGGQLGDGTTISQSSPIQIGTSSWVSIATGVNSTYGMYAGLPTILAWGAGTAGDLGDNTLVSKSSPVFIESRGQNVFYPQLNGNLSWTNITTTVVNSMGIVSNGRLFVWGGSTSVGQLGDNTAVAKSSPVQLYVGSYLLSPVQIGSSTWTAIASAGDNRYYLGNPVGAYALGILANGAAYGWGINQAGRIGDGTTINRSSPVAVLGSISAASIYASLFGSAILATNGALYVWGNNATGSIGDNTTISKSSPIKIGSLSWTMVALADSDSTAADKTVIAIASNGALYSWGNNTYGQLGTGVTGSSRSSPVQLGSLSWTAIAGRFAGFSAITTDRRLFAWGISNNGQLGDGTTIAKSSPIQIGSNSNWRNVYGFGAADTVDGSMYLWGVNTYGRYGDGT